MSHGLSSSPTCAPAGPRPAGSFLVARLAAVFLVATAALAPATGDARPIAPRVAGAAISAGVGATVFSAINAHAARTGTGGAQSGSSELRGKIVAIEDGDTVTLLNEAREQIRIRLADIDAPEVAHGAKRPGQAFGQASRQSLAEMAFGQEARAVCREADQYGRRICRIHVGETDVNLEQVRRGLAWPYVKYLKDPALVPVAERARQDRTGLWADKAPVAPWDWREGCWKADRCPGAAQ